MKYKINYAGVDDSDMLEHWKYVERGRDWLEKKLNNDKWFKKHFRVG